LYGAGNENDVTVSKFFQAGNENELTVTIFKLVGNGNDLTVTSGGNDAHLWEQHYFLLYSMFHTQSTPDFSGAERYGLQNTTCLYAKDVASAIIKNKNGSNNALLYNS
jgi:hypothetical protein